MAREGGVVFVSFMILIVVMGGIVIKTAADSGAEDDMRRVEGMEGLERAE